jgi:glycosyltransferase involved in cell wall biosynthesis
MRLLWLNHRDLRHPQAGGAERTLHEVARRLVARGDEVVVWSCRWKGCPSGHEFVDGVEIRRFADPVAQHAVIPFALRAEGRADLVIDDMAHALPWGSPWFTDAPGLVFFRHLHARSLVGQLGFPLRNLVAATERRYASVYRTWPFVTESSTAEEDLVALGIDRRRIRRIPPGVDAERFHPLAPAREPLLVWFGRMMPYKRPDHAIRVLERVRQRGLPARLRMIGDGPSLAPARDLARRLSLDPWVEFSGFVPEGVLPRLVGPAWVNLHTAITEGWALSAMEAAACGVPTAGYAIPGLKDAVADGESGLLVPSGDVNRLADAAARLLAEPDGWRARARARAGEFTWERAVDRWQSLFAELLRSPAAGA